MTIIRGVGSGDAYIAILRSAAQDSRLSFRARGILLAVMSRPEDWRTTYRKLAREATEGEDAVARALRELEQHGYLRRPRVHDGRHISTRWIISDDPSATGPGFSGPRKLRPRKVGPGGLGPGGLGPGGLGPGGLGPGGLGPAGVGPAESRPLEMRDTKKDTPPPTPSGAPSGDIDALVVVVEEALDGRAPKPSRRTLRGACAQLLAKGWTSEHVAEAIRTNDWRNAGAGAVATYLQDLALQPPRPPGRARRAAPGPKHCGTCDPVTRMIEDPETRVPRRCPTCHPLRKEPA